MLVWLTEYNQPSSQGPVSISFCKSANQKETEYRKNKVEVKPKTIFLIK